MIHLNCKNCNNKIDLFDGTKDFICPVCGITNIIDNINNLPNVPEDHPLNEDKNLKIITED